ncbi:putative sugar ABC transporter, substrate-binding protein [Syntrophomonas wolfei subsp. wolfei str. Goettingen G311]|uniref:Putative sugar ABC transporter, substrate-binding protein n=2 Tax=Syntrophomonas wolfei TaxID=863 RepID=Q0AZU3_SYNWW|nr:putative sugar ABC transporter, substrate-binding protein [Syntrophomonas wolfei subsp. wolfei str. Goettingen G311]
MGIMKKSRFFIAVLLIWAMSLSVFGCSKEDSATTGDAKKAETGEKAPATKGKIAFVTFATGVPYFEIGAAGAKQAGQALGYEVVYKGPAKADSAAEIQIINDLVTQGEVKAIVVACMDSKSIIPALKKAREADIKVVTWDLDCEPEGRDCYAGLMDLVVMGNEWIESMVRSVGDEGEYAIVMATLTNEFMNKRIDNMKKYAAEKYPKLKLVAVESCDADPQKAYQISKDLLTKYPNLKCIATSSTEAFSSAAKAIEDDGKIGQVYVVGGLTPNLAKPAFKSGAAKEAVLWDPGKWAGFGVTIATQLIEGKTFDKVGKVEITGFPKAELFAPGILYYHELLTFTPENVDRYDF